MPALQRQRRPLQKSIEILDLLQHSTILTLIADLPRDALQKKLDSNLLDRAQGRIVWISLPSEFDR
jgi:hypothetical protein